MIEPLDPRSRGPAALRAVPRVPGLAAPHPPGHLVRSLAVDGHCRIVVTGEADCAVAAEMGEAMALALAGRPHRITMDLRGVTFADSSFLKVLLGAKASADAAGIDFVLSGTDDGAVARMFAITGLADHFASTPARTPTAGA